MTDHPREADRVPLPEIDAMLARFRHSHAWLVEGDHTVKSGCKATDFKLAIDEIERLRAAISSAEQVGADPYRKTPIDFDERVGSMRLTERPGKPGRWYATIIGTDHVDISDDDWHFAKRLAACWNAFIGVEIEAIDAARATQPAKGKT